MEKDITINELARMVNRGFEEVKSEIGANKSEIIKNRNDILINRKEIMQLKEDINDLHVHKANYISRFEFNRLENRVEVLEDEC